MDYDVAALSLSTPPADASLTTYRPAVLVKNQGRFPAVAFGELSAYKAGRRVWYSLLTSASIPPGESGLANAGDDWSPDTQGDYTFFGAVTCHLDQVESNNQLAPVTVHVGPEPPPPPPPVAPHASQHEHGGSDVVDVDDLPGKLRDQQSPEPHASSHQAAGDDQLNVAGLAGVLGDPQVPTDHGNEHHTTDFASSAELANHAGAAVVHSAATNLANRNLSGDDSGLVIATQLAKGSEPGGTPQTRFLALDRIWRAAAATTASLGANAEPVEVLPQQLDSILLSLPVPAAWFSTTMQFAIIIRGYIHSLLAPNASITLTLMLDDEDIATLIIPSAQTQDRDFTVSGEITGSNTGATRAALSFLSVNDDTNSDVQMFLSSGNTIETIPIADTTISIHAKLNNFLQGSFLASASGYIRALHQPA